MKRTEQGKSTKTERRRHGNKEQNRIFGNEYNRGGHLQNDGDSDGMLFTQDEAVLAFAVRYIRVVLPFQWCYAAFNAIMSFANGMGKIRYSTIVNIILLWGVRIPASYLLAWLGYGGYAMAGVSLSFVVGLLAMLFYYKSHAWADICARAEAQEAA